MGVCLHWAVCKSRKGKTDIPIGNFLKHKLSKLMFF